MVSLDSTLFVQIINFLLLIFILNVLLYKPILRIMDERKKRLQDSEEEIKSLQQTVDRKTAEYEEKIRLAKLEAMNQRTDIQKEGAEAGGKIIAEAKEEIAKMMEEFKAKMAKEMDDARVILQTQSRTISLEIAEKILGRNV